MTIGIISNEEMTSTNKTFTSGLEIDQIPIPETPSIDITDRSLNSEAMTSSFVNSVSKVTIHFFS